MINLLVLIETEMPRLKKHYRLIVKSGQDENNLQKIFEIDIKHHQYQVIKDSYGWSEIDRMDEFDLFEGVVTRTVYKRYFNTHFKMELI
jgi:hypothetical protein